MRVHISGSPGSGKTTLGERIEKIFDVIVKDTDDFTHDLPKDVSFMHLLDSKIQTFLTNHKKENVVFVGIMDITLDGNTHIYKFKEDTPLQILLKRFYSRIIKVGEQDSNFWEDVTNGKEIIPSSQDKISEVFNTKESHLQLGYKPLEEEAIFTLLSNLTEPMFLRYLDTNYIYGTHLEFTLWRETGLITTWQGTQLGKVPITQVNHVFNMAREEISFHKRTEKDQAQCCDIPYRVIEYGNSLVTSMEDALTLRQTLYNIYQQQKIN
jgi:hypothetical protein